MFMAFLKDETIWQPMIQHPILQMSLNWLKKYADTAEFGNYPLGEPEWYANVHGYSTLNAVECTWENHTRTIDVQYMVSGSVCIRWTTVRQLGPPRRYLQDKDREEFSAPLGVVSILYLLPGMVTIFLPGDAHCPKIALTKPEILRKVVIKIPVCLLGGQDMARSVLMTNPLGEEPSHDES